jgi:hypothetical protein
MNDVPRVVERHGLPRIEAGEMDLHELLKALQARLDAANQLGESRRVFVSGCESMFLRCEATLSALDSEHARFSALFEAVAREAGAPGGGNAAAARDAYMNRMTAA